MRSRRSPFGRVVILSGLLVVVSCSRGGSAGPSPPPAPVTVAAVEKKAVPVEIRAIGNVEATSVVEIRARVGGELKAVHFTEGRKVREGDLLFTIDPRPYEVALAEAEAKLVRDRVLAQNSREEVDRYGDLVQKEYVTREQYNRSVATAAAAEAWLKADEADVENARLQLGYCTITAPVSGRTGDLLVHAGNLVKANDDKPMLVLRRTRPVFVIFSVPERHLPEIRRRRAEGPLEVTVTPPGDGVEPRRGPLTFVDNTVNTATGTIELKATFPNEDDALWPGQFVDVVLTLATQPDAVVVPSQAVQNGQQGAYVFVVKEDSTVESRPVEVARTFGGDAVIAKGVTPGEKVVTEGQLRLVPGVKVAVKGAS